MEARAGWSLAGRTYSYLGETKVKELLAKYNAKMRGGFKTKQPSIVFNPVQRTAAHVEKTPVVQVSHFCSHLVHNTLLGNTQSVNVVTLTVRRELTYKFG